MIRVKINSFSFDSVKRRISKALGLGKSDIQTSVETGPFGFDSGPLKDMIAIRSATSDTHGSIIVGYINKNQIAKEGESRMFSVNPSTGNISFSIHLKTNGTVEIGGAADNLVKYTPLDTELQKLILSINQQLGLISAGIATAGGAYTPQLLQSDFSAAKAVKVKTL